MNEVNEQIQNEEPCFEPKGEVVEETEGVTELIAKPTLIVMLSLSIMIKGIDGN